MKSPKSKADLKIESMIKKDSAKILEKNPITQKGVKVNEALQSYRRLVQNMDKSSAKMELKQDDHVVLFGQDNKRPLPIAEVLAVSSAVVAEEVESHQADVPKSDEGDAKFTNEIDYVKMATRHMGIEQLVRICCHLSKNRSTRDSAKTILALVRIISPVFFIYLHWLWFASEQKELRATQRGLFGIYQATSTLARFGFSDFSSMLQQSTPAYWRWYQFMQHPDTPRHFSAVLRSLPSFLERAGAGKFSTVPSDMAKILSARVQSPEFKWLVQACQTPSVATLGICSILSPSVQNFLYNFRRTSTVARRQEAKGKLAPDTIQTDAQVDLSTSGTLHKTFVALALVNLADDIMLPFSDTAVFADLVQREYFMSPQSSRNVRIKHMMDDFNKAQQERKEYKSKVPAPQTKRGSSVIMPLAPQTIHQLAHLRAMHVQMPTLIDSFAETLFVTRGLDELAGLDGQSDADLKQTDARIAAILDNFDTPMPEAKALQIQTDLWMDRMKARLALRKQSWREQIQDPIRQIYMEAGQKRIPSADLVHTVFPLANLSNVDWSQSAQWVSEQKEAEEKRLFQRWADLIESRKKIYLPLCMNDRARIRYGRALFRLAITGEMLANLKVAEEASEFDRDMMTRKKLLVDMAKGDSELVAKQQKAMDVLPSVNLLAAPLAKADASRAKVIRFWANMQDGVFIDELKSTRRLQGMATSEQKQYVIERHFYQVLCLYSRYYAYLSTEPYQEAECTMAQLWQTFVDNATRFVTSIDREEVAACLPLVSATNPSAESVDRIGHGAAWASETKSQAVQLAPFVNAQGNLGVMAFASSSSSSMSLPALPAFTQPMSSLGMSLPPMPSSSPFFDSSMMTLPALPNAQTDSASQFESKALALASEPLDMTASSDVLAELPALPAVAASVTSSAAEELARTISLPKSLLQQAEQKQDWSLDGQATFTSSTTSSTSVFAQQQQQESESWQMVDIGTTEEEPLPSLDALLPSAEQVASTPIATLFAESDEPT